MTINLLVQIFKARKVMICALTALLLGNIGLYAYRSLFQAPRLIDLQNMWFEKRKLASGSLTDVATIYRQGTADIEMFRSRIPAKREFARVVGDIFEAASSNGLSVQGVTYKPETVKGEGLVLYEVTLNVIGKYAGIKSFIADIDRLKSMSSIDTISLNSSSYTKETVGLKIQLSSYLRSEEK